MTSAEHRYEATEPQRSTMLELVQSLARDFDTDEDVVATASTLITSGQIVLTGNFKGCLIEV